MNSNIKIYFLAATLAVFSLILSSCADSKPQKAAVAEGDNKNKTAQEKTYPNKVIPYLEDCRILLGNGETITDLKNYEHPDFFYTKNDGVDWVVYKTPNSGTTSPNSSNTRTELAHNKDWIPEAGGKLTGRLKVMHVSTTGDARVAASYSTVVGQIHSGEGHENEPLKIFYKKFPGHTKGSVFWNYEINTEGDNSKRWDYSYPVWGYDMSVVGTEPDSYPVEPSRGIALGEEFAYEVNVYRGIMYLTFTSEGHPPKTFVKNLIASQYKTQEAIPEQTRKLFGPIGRDGVERANAYAGESQYFKQGAYNQTNGKKPKTNIVWSSGAKTYGGDILKQYENGSYTEVWFREGTVGPSTPPLN